MKNKTVFIAIAGMLLFLIPGSVRTLHGNSAGDIKQTDAEFSDNIRVTSDTMDFSLKTSVITFRNNVTANNPEYILNCNSLFISPDKDNRIESMQAEGNVRLKAENGEMTCHIAKYSRSTGEFILEQNVTLKQENSDWSADRITVFIHNGQFEDIHCEGNVKGSIPMEKILPDSETGNPKED